MNAKFVQIADTYNALNQKESELIVSFINSGINISDTEQQIYLKIIDSIKENNQKKFENLNSSMKNDVFNVYLNGLEQLILDSLTWASNFNNNEQYTTFAKQRFYVKKLFMQGQVFHGRGQRKIAERLYKKGAKIALQFEFYSDLIDCLTSLSSIYRTAKNNAKVAILKREIKHAEVARKAIEKAEEAYQFMVSISQNQQNNKGWEKVKKLIIELKYRYKISKSNYVLHHLTTIQAEYYKYYNQFSKADYYLKKLHKILITSPELYIKRREGAVWLNLAENAMKLYDFKKAIQYASKSRSFFKSTTNQSYAYHMEFYSHLRLAQYKKAINVLRILDDDPFKGIWWLDGKRKLSLAWLYWKVNKPKLMQIQLINSYESIKSIPVWNVSHRMLTLINYIEAEKIDLALAELDNLKIYIRRGKFNELEEYTRLQSILKFFTEWSKVGFDKMVNPILKEIQLKAKEQQQDFYDWEIIPLPILMDDLLNKTPKLLIDS